MWGVDDVEKRNIPPQSLVTKPICARHVIEPGVVPLGYVRAVLVDHQGVRVRLEEIAKVVLKVSKNTIAMQAQARL